MIISEIFEIGILTQRLIFAIYTDIFLTSSNVDKKGMMDYYS